MNVVSISRHFVRSRNDKNSLRAVSIQYSVVTTSSSTKKEWTPPHHSIWYDASSLSMERSLVNTTTLENLLSITATNHSTIMDILKLITSFHHLYWIDHLGINSCVIKQDTVQSQGHVVTFCSCHSPLRWIGPGMLLVFANTVKLNELAWHTNPNFSTHET
jgi:uncharacterized protein YcfL